MGGVSTAARLASMAGAAWVKVWHDGPDMLFAAYWPDGTLNTVMTRDAGRQNPERMLANVAGALASFRRAA